VAYRVCHADPGQGYATAASYRPAPTVSGWSIDLLTGGVRAWLPGSVYDFEAANRYKRELDDTTFGSPEKAREWLYEKVYARPTRSTTHPSSSITALFAHATQISPRRGLPCPGQSVQGMFPPGSG
jgi:hypothetical protein